MALCGVSGSGKTYSALLLAKGLGGKIAMIDTENSGDLYSDDPKIPPYYIEKLTPPYSPERYVDFIKEAGKEGYDILIIDSLSHGWAGEGGVLDIVDKAAKASRSGNSFTAWKDATPQHNRLLEAIINSNMHVIATLRSKEKKEVTNDNGKMRPVKLGLAPIQREGIEYEFTTVLDISLDGHITSASKDRTGLFDGQFFKIDETHGHQLAEWLGKGAAYVPPDEEEAKSFIDLLEMAPNMEYLAQQFKLAKTKGFWQRAKCRSIVIEAKEKRKAELAELVAEKEKPQKQQKENLNLPTGEKGNGISHAATGATSAH